MNNARIYPAQRFDARSLGQSRFNVSDDKSFRRRHAMHVDPVESAHRKIDQRLTLGRLAQIAGLQGDHGSASRANHLNGGFRVVDAQTATDHHSALASKR
jgi:hypothetical protein